MGKKDFSLEKMQRACRIRKIRENIGLTQAAFAELLEITLDGYIKIERGDNNISLAILEKLQDKLSISSDYILYGKTHSADAVWTEILNCKEEDKLLLMLRLLFYFTKSKRGIYPLNDEQTENDELIVRMMRKIHDLGEE